MFYLGLSSHNILFQNPNDDVSFARSRLFRLLTVSMTPRLHHCLGLRIQPAGLCFGLCRHLLVGVRTHQNACNEDKVVVSANEQLKCEAGLRSNSGACVCVRWSSPSTIL